MAPSKSKIGFTTDKLPLVKQRLYETMTLEDKGVCVNHTLQQTAMISRPHIRRINQHNEIFRSIRPIQAFYVSIDRITINSHTTRIWTARSVKRHTAI